MNSIRLAVLCESIAKEIIANWERWEGEAGQAAQIEQNPDAYIESMVTVISTAIANRINKAEAAGLT